MVMDYGRTCFRVEMRLFNDATIQTPVYWFKADRGAKLFPGPHRFGSRVWQKEKLPQTLGEQLSTRKWSNGANPIGYLGLNFCGPALAFLEGGSLDHGELILTDANGVAPCCKLPTLRAAGGLAFGGEAEFPWAPFGGVAIGGEGLFPLLASGGVAIGGEGLFPGAALVVASGGVAFGGEGLFPWLASGGVAIGGEGLFPGAALVVAGGGVAIGGEGLFPGAAQVVADGGSKFGGAGIQWEGSNVPMIEGTVLPSAARTVLTVSADQDNPAYDRLQLVFNVSAIGAGTIFTVKVQGKDPISGNYYDLHTTATTVSATGTYTLNIGCCVVSTGQPALSILNAQTILPKTWRVSVSPSNANSSTYSVAYVMG